MILLAAAGPKIFVTPDTRLSDEMVLWQEHNQIIVSSREGENKFYSLVYEIAWEHESPGALRGTITRENREMGFWRAEAIEDQIRMSLQIRNTTDVEWPVAELSMCYKHRGAKSYWDPTLERTYIEWAGAPVTIRERIQQMHGEHAFWPKNHLHRLGFDRTFDRYNRVGLRNPASAGWQHHRNATSGGWIGIVSTDAEWVSGICWDKSEMLAHNAPDYGCIHAGLTIGYDVKPQDVVEGHGVILVGENNIESLMRLSKDL